MYSEYLPIFVVANGEHMTLRYKYDRQIISSIERLKDKYPILAITGPRQSGKTTLLKYFFEDYTYVSLEDPDLRDFAKMIREDFSRFIRRKQSSMRCSEYQRCSHTSKG